MLSGILNSTSSMTESEESSESDQSSSYSWISWFVSQPGKEFLLEVDEEFIRDNFNLYGLRQMFHYYDHALEMILEPESPDEEDLQDNDYAEIYKDASELYGLIHQRFIMSPRGLSMLKEKFGNSDFGTCPRIHCDSQPCLPIGLRDDLRQSSVRIYCPRCEQVYAPRIKQVINLDGAFFGTSLPLMFLQTYPDLLPLDEPKPFDAKIFGFKIHQRKSVIHKKQEYQRDGIRLERVIDVSTIAVDDFDLDSS
jgi:casein kinase II subunit beta